MPSSVFSEVGEAFIGGCFAPNGKIYMVPYQTDSVGVIDLENNIAYTSSLGNYMAPFASGNKWACPTLAPNGKIYCPPHNESSIFVIDPENEYAYTSSMGASIALNGTTYWGSTLGSDGKIYCAPWSAQNVLIIDPETETATTTNFGLDLSDAGKFQGIVHGGDGRLYCVPYNSTTFLIIDPINGTATRSNLGANLSGNYFGGLLTTNGRMYLFPATSTPNFVTLPPVSSFSYSDKTTTSAFLAKF